MATKNTKNTKAKSAGQTTADPGKGALLPCKVKTNGMLYRKCHHRINKQLAIPEEDARKLESLGHVEILPGIA